MGLGKKERAMKIRGLKGLMGGAGLIILMMAGCGADGGSYSSEELSSGSDGGTGISNTFSSPSEMSVGDIMPIEFTGSNQVSVDMRGVEAGANFILALGSSNTTGSGTTIQLATASEVAPEISGEFKGLIADESAVESEPEIDEAYGADEIFQSWIRASESGLAYSEDAVQDAAPEVAMKSMSFKAVSAGDVESFRVLSSLSSTSSYVSVEANARCVGDNVVFYVDTEVPSSILSDGDVSELCAEFDATSGEEQDLLGSASDVDDDAKVHVLMTKQINKLGALGGGIITGYFYAGDLYVRSSSNSVSNEREIIYTMVPDPSGMWGSAISHSFAMSNLLPAVLPHELQHAINYNQHVFVSEGTTEENWLNEGLSHFMEDYLGVGVENPSRYAMFLASPSTYGIVTQSSPNLLERGAAYLFLRYLYEQSGDGQAFLRALVQTSNRGVANLVSAYGGASEMATFSQMMARWTIALAMTDRGISQDSRYVYTPRSRHPLTNNWQGVCIDCDADDNRGTELTGVNLNPYYGYHTASIDASTAKFFSMTMLPNEMVLEGSSDGGNYGILIRSK